VVTSAALVQSLDHLPEKIKYRNTHSMVKASLTLLTYHDKVYSGEYPKGSLKIESFIFDWVIVR
jgi:hypothetical protein